MTAKIVNSSKYFTRDGLFFPGYHMWSPRGLRETVAPSASRLPMPPPPLFDPPPPTRPEASADEPSGRGVPASPRIGNVPNNTARLPNRNVPADVEFVVHSEDEPAPRTISGHRQFLAMRNDRLYELFFHLEPDQRQYRVDGLHPDGFSEFITYLYSGVFNPGSFEEAMFTREAAKRYEAQDLISACTEYIAGHLTADKVCPLLDCLNTRDVGLIDEAAIAMLKNSGPSVLRSATFVSSLETTLDVILDVVAGVPETLVADSLRRWAQHKRETALYREQILPTLETVMRPFLPKLRVLTLTPNEFVNGLGSWGVLSDSEISAILQNLVTPSSVPLPHWVNPESQARSLFSRHYRTNPREDEES